MIQSDFKYIRDTNIKALKVIESCTTIQHVAVSIKYINLLKLDWNRKFIKDLALNSSPNKYYQFLITYTIVWDMKIKSKLSKLK